MRQAMVFRTLIVLGTLTMTAPYATQALGFGALGPVEGKPDFREKPLPLQLMDPWTLWQLAGKNDTQATFRKGHSSLAFSGWA